MVILKNLKEEISLNRSICVCCQTNDVGKSKVMCVNCWHWITEEMTMTDVAVVIAGIKNREPKNKYAKEICEYLVADNYMQGKAKLVKYPKEK